MQCFPLFSVLLAMGNPQVDYLSLDVEGTELGILKTIPFDKVLLLVFLLCFTSLCCCCCCCYYFFLLLLLLLIAAAAAVAALAVVVTVAVAIVAVLPYCCFEHNQLFDHYSKTPFPCRSASALSALRWITWGRSLTDLKTRCGRS